VEDSENDALLIADALRRGGYAPRWTRVESGPELRAALARQEWHAILSDWRLPGFSALDALAICREAGVQARFLIVSGSAEDSFQAEAARAGVAVWVSKDHLERLPAAVAELRIGR
jgi:CheY-like chemotaxis protein